DRGSSWARVVRPGEVQQDHATRGDDALTPSDSLTFRSAGTRSNLQPTGAPVALTPVVTLESRAHTQGEAANDHWISCPRGRVADRRGAWDQCAVRGPRRPRCRPTSRSFITRSRV